MVNALRYEWTRIRTIRSTWWLSVIAVVFGVGLSLVAAIGTSVAFDSGHPPQARDVATMGPAITTQFAVLGAPYFVAYILAMVGVFAWGHEYRHGMIRATLTALSSRSHAWLAKYVVVALWVGLVALVTLLGSALMAYLFLHDNGVPVWTPATWRAIGRTVGYTVVFVWLASAFTSLVRNQTAALVLMFLWPLAVESVVSIIFAAVPALRTHADLTRFLPFHAGGRIIASQHPGHLFGTPLSAWGGLVVFGGVTVVALVLSSVLFRRRDA